MTTNSNETITDVVVLGAGLTGLTTAHYLNKFNCKEIKVINNCIFIDFLSYICILNKSRRWKQTFIFE